MFNIFSSAFIYYPLSDRVEVLESMNEGRYTFTCIKKGNFIYVLGGRTYGEDEHAILRKCERYNISTGKWENISNMHHRRCSFVASCVDNMIYVVGGYGGKAVRHASFERYYERENIWELMGITLSEPMEAFTLINMSSPDFKKILILGGRSSNDDSEQAICYDFTNGFDSFYGINAGSIGGKRCLHKHIPISHDGSVFLLFGGFVSSNTKRISAFEFYPVNEKVTNVTQKF